MKLLPLQGGGGEGDGFPLLTQINADSKRITADFRHRCTQIDTDLVDSGAICVHRCESAAEKIEALPSIH